MDYEALLLREYDLCWREDSGSLSSALSILVYDPVVCAFTDYRNFASAK